MGNVMSVEDRLEIGQLFTRYGRLVDSGDADGYVELFTEDGSFARTNSLKEATGSGLPPAEFRGHEALHKLVRDLAEKFQGKMRHQLTDICIEPGDSADKAKGTCYGLITDWREGEGKLSMHATYYMEIVRTSAGWRFREVTIERLPSD